MATSQSQSFRGGSVSPGQGIHEDDIKPLVINRTTAGGVAQQQIYNPLNGANFSFGRVTFKKSGNRVIGSYDPFDSDKNITVATMDAVEFSESTLTISDSDYALIVADYASGNPVVLISENGGSDVVWQLALKSSAGYTFTSTTQTSIRVATVSPASGHAVTITTADFVPEFFQFQGLGAGAGQYEDGPAKLEYEGEQFGSSVWIDDDNKGIYAKKGIYHVDVQLYIVRGNISDVMAGYEFTWSGDQHRVLIDTSLTYDEYVNFSYDVQADYDDVYVGFDVSGLRGAGDYIRVQAVKVTRIHKSRT